MSKADADSPVLLLACRKIANQHLAVLLDNLFNNTDETLQEIVEKETSPDLRVRYAESMQKLRANRAAIVSGFESNFNSLYQGKSKRQAPPGDADSARLGKFSVDSLALVDDDALEEQIAVNNMIAAAMNRFQPPLRALKARYAVLLNAEEINDDECPVFPKAIKEAFGQAIRTVDLDILIKLTLYKLFDRFVLTQLGEMYKELNQYLVKSGILPDFKGTASRPRSEEYQQRHSLEHLQQELAAVTAASAGFGANVAGGGFGGGGFSAAGIPGLGAQGAGFSGAGAPGVGGGGAMGNASPIDSESLFNMLRQLLVMQQPAVHMAEHAAIHYETRDVVSALDNLQRTAPAGDFREVSEAGRGGQLRSNLVDVISQQRGDLESGAINAADSATVDLISMLFDVIFEDEDLPDRAKALIARLQIPLLKVAIIDPKLFEDKAHPARKLLNALTEAGVIAGEGGSGDGDTLYFKMESVVQSILLDFTDDVTLLGRLLEDFNIFLDAERARCKAGEQEKIQAAEARENRVRVQAAIEPAIALRVGDLVLPSKVQAMLDGPWRQVLQTIGEREKMDSEHWRQALGLVEELVWSLSHKETPQERQQTPRRIPMLVRDLRRELETNSDWSKDDTDAFFQNLEAYHLAILRGQRLKTRKE
ncbi:MAG: hypothetical protein A2V90_08600, partial [Gammaproteobacteria bacterium RBG_16_57_12]